MSDSCTNSKNIYIQAENLEALKLLQKTYFNKVDLIYIDPPYNTGGDLIYNDKFKMNTKEFYESLHLGMQSNQSSDGKYHTKWLNMIYPRLLIARSFLTDDGMIFISIDDNELSNLISICDEIFSEENRLSIITCKVKAPSGVASGAQMVFDSSEYLVVYAKNKNYVKYNHLMEDVEIVDGSTKTSSNYNMILKKINYSNMKLIKKFDNDELYEVPATDFEIETMKDKSAISYYINRENVFRTAALSGGREKIIKNFIDTIPNSINKLFVYRHKPEKGKRAGKLVDDLIYKNGGILFLKDFVSVDDKNKTLTKQQHITNIIMNDWWQGIANEGNVTFKNGKKPLKLLDIVLSFCPKKNPIILDFFSGSASTGEAVLKKNIEDGNNRSFILIQLPEEIDDKEFNNICELGIQRLNNAINQIKTSYFEQNLFIDKQDLSFKVFKIDSSNIMEWDNDKELDETTLFDYSEVFKEGRSKEDIVYEIMLKYGVFDMQMKEVEVNCKTMYRIGKRYMIVCLEDEVTKEDIEAIADLRVKNVVFKESGFENDNDKINAVHNLMKAGVEDIKCI